MTTEKRGARQRFRDWREQRRKDRNEKNSRARESLVTTRRQAAHHRAAGGTSPAEGSDPMKPWRCYLGKHKWERRTDGGREYWVCVHCDKEDRGPTPKYVPPVPPGGDSGGFGF